jgi:hypothetical protein
MNTIGNVTGAQLYNPYPDGSAQNLPIQAGSTAYGLNIGSTGLKGEMTSGDIYTMGAGYNSLLSYTARWRPDPGPLCVND